jgi:hypothetical protein
MLLMATCIQKWGKSLALKAFIMPSPFRVNPPEERV